MADILIVDDEPSARLTLALLLRKREHRVVQAEGVGVAAKVLAERAFDLVVTDLRMPDGDGLEVLRLAKAHCPEVVVILLTAYAGWESAKEAMRLGAYDYFEKGKDPDEFLHRVEKALEEKGLRHENENLRRQVQERYSLPGLIAQSKEMQTVLELVLRVAPTDATVLIQGESGTGKEVIAVVLPPLRERREDIPTLAEHFLRQNGEKQGRSLRLSAEAIDKLLRYPWPGNVRELENAMERTAILAQHDVIGPDDLPPHIVAGTPLGSAPSLPQMLTLAEAEKLHILQTLERSGWNHSRAAETLAIGRTSLWRKLKEYQIDDRSAS